MWFLKTRNEIRLAVTFSLKKVCRSLFFELSKLGLKVKVCGLVKLIVQALFCILSLRNCRSLERVACQRGEVQLWHWSPPSSPLIVLLLISVLVLLISSWSTQSLHSALLCKSTLMFHAAAQQCAVRLFFSHRSTVTLAFSQWCSCPKYCHVRHNSWWENKWNGWFGPKKNGINFNQSKPL